MDEEKIRLIKAIINVFETGKAEGDYGATALLKDNAGISYGRSQATDGGGNLDRIVWRYLDLQGSYGDELRPYLDRLHTDETARVDPDHPPAWVLEFMAVLSEAGRNDPLMKQAQDGVFDEQYWVPARNQAKEMSLELPLSWAVVYDSVIHSGPSGVWRIRRLFPEFPPSRGGTEKSWVDAYVHARYAWLASHPNAEVRRTTYRMKAFLSLIDETNWSLDVPIRMPQPRVDIT